MSARRSLAVLLALALAAATLLAPPAQAKETRLLQQPFGAFTEPRGLAVDQGSHDVYAIDGRSEVQRIKVSATAGKAKLKFGGKEKELEFNANSEDVRDALRAVICGGANCLFVNGGPGNAAGSSPYVVNFQTSLSSTDVEQIVCENGSPPLTGGSGCTVETLANGVSGTIARYHANGTPSEFSALGANTIDGRGGADLTPQGGLHFSPPFVEQVAVDESGTATDGDVYATQFGEHLLDIFASSGEFKGQLTQYEETPGNPATLKPLGNVCGVAVDPAGDVYLADFSTGIHKYAPSANPVTNTDNVANFTGVPSPCTLAAGAGPSAGFLFADALPGGLFKLDASSGAVKYEVSSGSHVTVTVDPTSGHVLSATGSEFVPSGEVKEFDASGPSSATPLGSIAPGGSISGVAVDGATGKGGTVYLSRAGDTHLDAYGPIVVVPDVVTEAASEVAASTATLHGTISAAAGPEAHCSFQYATEAAYLADKAIPGHDGFGGATSAACEPSGPFTGSSLNAVSAKATLLSHETPYRFRIVGENEHTKAPSDDPGATLAFATFGKPAIKGGSASEITTTTAEISGEVNPAGLQTSFAVQYVSEADFQESGYNKALSAPLPAKGLGSLAAFLPVSQELSQLTPETAYRFRLTATNSDGTTRGPEGAFATFAVPAGPLDHRAYEMVTPAFKAGEPYAPEPEPRGGLGGTCKACTPGWDKIRMPMQSSPDGDAVVYEGNPFQGGFASGANEYRSRRSEGGWGTADLSGPLLQDEIDVGQGFKAFSSDLRKATLLQADPSLTPEAPANFANLYLQEEGKEELRTLITTEPPTRAAGINDLNSFRVNYAGANSGTQLVPEMSHVAFQANDALTAKDPGIAPAAPPVGIEERDLYEWSGGELHLVNVLPGNATAAPNAVIGSGLLLAVQGGENFNFSHAISTDGSRIFWSTAPGGQLYLRIDGKETREIPDHAGRFLTATPSGSEVLLSDGRIYGHLEAEPPSEEADLTGGQGGFQGILGASEDLRRVYFVDTAALTPPSEVNANPKGPEHAEAGKPNLYLWEGGAAPHEGTTSFIGILRAEDNQAGIGDDLGIWHAAPGNRLAQVTPDGRFLAFESLAQLTGYDTGGGVFETFEYDAQSHALACPSCNPSGERPLGSSNLALIRGGKETFPQPQNLPPEGEGRLFFESRDTLTPEDKNGHIQDVYEWEPGGVGSCAKPHGCLALISSGQSPKDSHFINASATGEDVFFDTRSQLVGADEDDFLDVYDARVGGGFEEAIVEPCLGEACKGASSEAGPAASPASAGFTVNEPPPPPPKPCRRGLVKRHGSCMHKHKAHKRRRHAARRPGGHR